MTEWSAAADGWARLGVARRLRWLGGGRDAAVALGALGWTFDGTAADAAGAVPEGSDGLRLLALAWGSLPPGGRLALAWRGARPRLLRHAADCGFAGAGEDGGAALLVRSAAAPRWRLAGLLPGEETAVERLFRSCFGHPLGTAAWRWKYGAGRGRAAVAWEGDELVAHYGGIERPALFAGRPCRALQMCDVMVAPGARGAFTRRGPFARTAAAFLDLEVGAGRPHLLGFGFPNGRHERLGERLGLYTPVDRIVEAVWEPPPRDPAPARPLATDETAAAVEPLWREMRASLAGAVVGVRDAAWIEHRYRAHPSGRYRVLLVEGPGGEAAGVAVVAPAAEGAWELLDVVAPLVRLGEVARAAVGWSAAQGAARVTAWISHHHGGALVEAGARLDEIDVHVPWFDPPEGPAAAELADRWFLSGGDTDFR